MSQTNAEITKEIVIAALQNGYINKPSLMSYTIEEANVVNANEITNFYNAVYKVVSSN